MWCRVVDSDDSEEDIEAAEEADGECEGDGSPGAAEDVTPHDCLLYTSPSPRD